ncbi:hypothetical protein Bbelb_358670 [Branchiostoma belcheri]|nr:hypothetical protein Bbelb_358670 [Branchiostoma belcheri]
MCPFWDELQRLWRDNVGIWLRFRQEVKQLYVKDGSTEVDSSIRRSFLTTSLHPNEESRACVRVIVAEHAGKTLDTFMDSPWGVRAEIAVQLLQLVNTLRGKDPDWVLFLTDVSFQNFAVDSRGRVRLIDLDDVMVIDRRTVVSHELTPSRPGLVARPRSEGGHFGAETLTLLGRV